MLSFLRGPDHKRTKISHLSSFDMENGRSNVSFRTDPTMSFKQSSIAFTLPPANPGPDPKDNSIVIPPFHAHPNQQEFFEVTSGTALFHLMGKKLVKPTGHGIVIRQGDYHKFTNASSTESLRIEARYDPPELVREEKFFRNLCGYLSDVAGSNGGMLESASVPQLALFAWEADMPICEPVLSLPKSIGIPVAYGMTWFLGVFVGKYLLGYKSTYDEYYHEGSQ